MSMLTLGSLGSQFTDALGNAIREFVAFIPALIGAIVLLIVGWIVAAIVRAVVRRVLGALHFDQLLERAGIHELTGRGGVRTDPAGLLARVVFWFVFLIFVLAAAKALGVEAITAIVTNIVLFLPSLFVALLIIIVGMVLARLAGDLVRDAMNDAGVNGGGVVGAIARYAILIFAALLALGQLGIGAGIIQTLFAAMTFGLALALALAFGLGGRETAKSIVESWYRSMSGPMSGPTRGSVGGTPVPPPSLPPTPNPPMPRG